MGKTERRSAQAGFVVLRHVGEGQWQVEGTTTKLNGAFRAARRALLLAKIDRAVANGDLTEEEAAERKERLASTRLPGYKPAGRAFSVDAAVRGECDREGDRASR